MFVCSLNGIKTKGSRFGPWGHWEKACIALQNLIQALPKGAFVFQGPGSAELWNIPGFDVNAEQVLEYVDNDQTGGLVIRAERHMRTMPRIPGDFHFQDTFPNGKKLAEMVASSIGLSTIFYQLLDACRKVDSEYGC